MGSLDNVSLFGRVGPLVRPPAERVKVVKKLAVETGIEEITYGELELSINLKNFVMVDAMDIHRPAQPIKSYIEVENGGLDNWRPRFKPGVNILFLLVKFRSDTKGKLRGSRFSRYDKLCGYVRRLLEEFIESWRLMGRVEVVEVNHDLGDLRDSLKDFIGGNEGHVFSVLLYVSDVDPYGDVIGRYEYEAILNKVYPHAIDLTDLLNGENRGDGLKTLRFKVINVIRDFAIRARALPHRLRPPQELGECVVVGIDATVKATRRGYLYPAAVVVLLKPDGTHEAYLQTVGVSDVDALVSALRETVRQITRRHEHVVAVINRASIKHILDRLISLDESFGELLNSYLLLSTFSKTHTYSRILRRYGDTFLNPTPRDIGLLVKLKQHEYRFNGVKITTSRFLSVTTSTPQSSGVEVGTVVPVVMSLTGGLDHTRAAEYLIALTNFARISYRSPSMPWPLRRADKLCKRVHRILDSIEDDSAIPMLQNYVMFL